MAKAYLKTSSYDPLNDPVYMSDRMRQYFQDILYGELESLLEKERQLSLSFPESSSRETDFVDQGLIDSLRFNHHAYQEHEHHLRQQVEGALQRLTDGGYGYCVATGKPIGVERLLATPYAAYCVDVQEEREDVRQGQWS